MKPLTAENLKLAEVRGESIALLNRLLAGTMTLRDLYGKHHWPVSDPALFPLHLLFDKHYREQADVVDAIAGRIQLLGGLRIAKAAAVADPVQFANLLDAHEVIIKLLKTVPREPDGTADPGQNDQLFNEVLRLHELQTCFLAAHLGKLPVARSDAAPPQKTRAAHASASGKTEPRSIPGLG